MADQDVLRGTLDLLILKTLTLEPMHGWGISARIQQTSRGVLDVNQGSLYPALQRLEQRGWVGSDWRQTENNRRAKYYQLTPAGKRAVGDETANWRQYVQAVELILDVTERPSPAEHRHEQTERTLGAPARATSRS